MKNQNFEKSHSAFFVPLSLIYRFQTEKVKKWLFRGWGEGEGARGGGGYKTVNNGTMPYFF